MRISSAYIAQMFVDSQNQQETALAQTQAQITSGKSFSQPSDNPVAASEVLSLQATLDQTSQYTANSNLAQSRLSIEDGTLTSITNLLQSVRSLALQGANATQTSATRATIATQISQQLQSLLQLANTQDGSGQYLFSGSATNTVPFSQSASSFVYNGTQSQRLVQIGSNRTVADSDSGAALFQQVRNGNGSFVASAASANTGSGIVGLNSVTDPTAWAAGSPPYTITFSSPSAYAVTDSTGASVQTGTFASGQTLSFNGAQLEIDGTPAAGDTFSVAPSSNQDMFTTLQNLVSALNSTSASGQTAVVNGINRAVEGIDQSLTSVTNIQSQVGSRLSAIDSQSTTTSTLTLQLNSTMSNLRDLDYASAITKLNQQMTGLQAAQASYVKIQGLSLFNYIQ
jgi:flagellar hook-associated protein 3 FlgL